MDVVLEALSRIERGATADSLEGSELDFKTDGRKDKETFADLAAAAVCFANASGGHIVLGVADGIGGLDAFVGSRVDPAVLRRQVFELTQPGLDVRVDEVTRGDAAIFVLTVPEGLDVHATGRGTYSWRRHATCLPMRPVDVARLSEERRGEDWSARPAGTAAVDDGALAAARRRLRELGTERGAMLSALAQEDLLQALGACTPSGELTRAGQLVLGAAAGTGRPRVIYQHRPSSGGEADHVLRLGGPLILVVERLLEAIAVRTQQTPMHLSDGRQVVLEDVPSLAVREAVMNAVAHGDGRTGQPVQVEHSPQSLVVTSPGPLVSGITVDNILTHAHRARFPALFALLHELKLVEQIGAGVDRMFRAMLRDGRSSPQITSTEDEVVVTLLGRDADLRVARFSRALPEPFGDDLNTLLVMTTLLRKRSVSAKDIVPVLQRTLERAEEVLRHLSSGGGAILEPSQGTVHRSHPHYRLRRDVVVALGSAVTYHRPATVDIERKICEHVAEYEWVNNRTVQNLFDVDVYRASALLKELVDRDVLVRTSEQTRGPSVRYGPGPSFVRPRRGRR